MEILVANQGETVVHMEIVGAEALNISLKGYCQT